MAVQYPQKLLYSFLSVGQRLLLAMQIFEFDRDVQKQKLHREHPEWSELEVIHQIMRQAFLPEPAPEWLEKKMRERLEQQRGIQ
jgi:hypothetical protein